MAVAVRDPAELVILDASDGSVEQRVALPATARHLTLSRAGSAIAVPAEDANQVVEVRVRDGRQLKAIRVGLQPHDATTARGRLFVGDERGNTVTVTGPGERKSTLPVATQPGGLTPARAGASVAVVSVKERLLELYDARSLERQSSVPAGVGPTHVAAEPRGNHLYVVDTDGDGLLVFKFKPQLELVRRVYLPGQPYGIAVDARSRRLWVTLTATNRLVELPAHGRPHILRTFATVRQPNTVAVDEKSGSVFVAGRHDGVVQMLSPSRATSAGRLARPHSRAVTIRPPRTSAHRR